MKEEASTPTAKMAKITLYLIEIIAKYDKKMLWEIDWDAQSGKTIRLACRR